MPLGTLTAGIASVTLNVPFPNDRDEGTEGAGAPSADFGFLAVYLSTSSGFTPGSGNLKGYVKGTEYTVNGLTPLVPVYVKWAYIPESVLSEAIVTPAPYIVQDGGSDEQLTATPNVVDGTLMATEIRGKRLIGSVLIDEGSAAAETKAAAGSTGTTTTLNLDNATDFYSGGGSAIVFPQNRDGIHGFRYTGKTGNQLTGVSGNMTRIRTGDAILSLPYGVMLLREYDGGGAISDSASDASLYQFRRTGGAGVCVPLSGSNPCDTFTFTTGDDGFGGPGLSGISGLAAFSDADVLKLIIDTTDLPVTASLTSGFNYTSLTLTGDMSKFRAVGGNLMMIRDGQFWELASFESVSGQVLTLTSGGFTPATTGVYTVIPMFSLVALGSNASYFSINTMAARSHFSPNGAYFGPTIVDGSLTIQADASVAQSLTVGTDLSVTGNVNVNGFVYGRNIEQTIVKPSFESVTSSTVLQADNDFAFAVEADKTYIAELVLFWDGAAAADFKFSFTGPAAAVVARYGVTGAENHATTFGTSLTLLTAGTTNTTRIEFILENGVNAGTVQFNWAQNTANATATRVLGRSWLSYREVV